MTTAGLYAGEVVMQYRLGYPSQRTGLASCFGVSSARQRRQVCCRAATATPVAQGASCAMKAAFKPAVNGLRQVTMQ